MSAGKKDELLKSLTRRDAQKPPMEVTYENKKALLGQMTERPPAEHIDDVNDSHIDSNIDNGNIDDNKSEINSEINSNINDEIKNNNDINSDIASNDDSYNGNHGSTDAIDALLSVTKKSVPSKTFKGFYLEPDVAKVLDKLAKKHGKGIQSQMVNEALRMVFRDKGLM